MEALNKEVGITKRQRTTQDIGAIPEMKLYAAPLKSDSNAPGPGQFQGTRNCREGERERFH